MRKFGLNIKYTKEMPISMFRDLFKNKIYYSDRWNFFIFPATFKSFYYYIFITKLQHL